MKEKGVIERIRHLSAPKIRYSIRSIVCASNIKLPSPYMNPHTKYLDKAYLASIPYKLVAADKNVYLKVDERKLSFGHLGS